MSVKFIYLVNPVYCIPTRQNNQSSFNQDALSLDTPNWKQQEV